MLGIGWTYQILGSAELSVDHYTGVACRRTLFFSDSLPLWLIVIVPLLSKKGGGQCETTMPLHSNNCEVAGGEGALGHECPLERSARS